MSITVEVVYEDGVLRPLEPLPLTEGDRIEVTFATNGTENEQRTAPDPMRAAALIAAVAAFAVPGKGPETGSVDHDHYLYGMPKRSETKTP